MKQHVNKPLPFQVFPEERKGAELDYRKKYGIDWLKAGGNQDPDKNNPNEEFLAAHPRFQLFCDSKYISGEGGFLFQHFDLFTAAIP